MRNSAFRRLICAVPVFAGARNPYQPLSAKPGKPDSLAVGKSGAAGERRSPVTASARNLPACICAATVNNNHCLSQGLRNLNIAYEGRAEPNRKDECNEYRETDFAKVAQSFDCFGVTVDKPQDFKKAFEAAMKSDLPAVIDVKTEFAIQAPLPWVPG